MRIFINQTDSIKNDKIHKTKFYKAAILFAEEYNKYVPDEEKARIVLPYSFLLAKTNFLFPEGIGMPPPAVGEEKKFIDLVKEKPDLFEFHYTYQDEQLYKQLHKSLFSIIQKMEAENPVEQTDFPKPEKHKPVIDEAAVKSLRKAAFQVNKDFRWARMNLDTWFADRCIGENADFPVLRAESSAGETVGGIGLFLVLLERSDTRKLLGITAKDLPDVSPENAEYYSALFTKAADLVRRINKDIEIREDQATVGRPVVKMRDSKKHLPKTSGGTLTSIVSRATTIKGFLEDIDQKWLERNNIAPEGQVLKMRGASGASLFQALIAADPIKEDLHIEKPNGLVANGVQGKMKASEAIKLTVDESFKSLVMGPEHEKEITIFAVDDKDFYLKTTGEEKQVEHEDGADVVTKIRSNPLTQKDEDGLAFLDVVKSGELYLNFAARLRKLAIDHPERAETIEPTIRALKSYFEIKDHGHAGAGAAHPSYEQEVRSILGSRGQERDVVAMQRAVESLGVLLEGDGKELPSDARKMVKSAIAKTVTLIPNHDRGGAKRAASDD